MMEPFQKVKRALFIFASPIDQGQVPKKSAVGCGIYHMKQDCFRRCVGRDLLKELLEIRYSNASKTFLHDHEIP